MSLFKEEFYTDDYDQEMLDFIEKKYPVTKDGYWGDEGSLVYGMGNDYFWTTDYTFVTNKLTKQQFKEKIGMTNTGEVTSNEDFTPDDLQVGQHVVELRNHRRALVVQGSKHKSLWFLDNQHWMKLSHRDDLTGKSGCDYDIMKVYFFGRYPNAINKDNVVWERKSPQQLEIDKLQAEVDERVKRINELKESM